MAMPRWVTTTALISLGLFGFLSGLTVASGIDWTAKTSALSALMTALFTVALTITSYLMWKDTNRMAANQEAQKEDFERSLAVAKQSADAAVALSATTEAMHKKMLMPIVLVQQIDFPENMESEDFLFIPIYFKNSGKSVALNFVSHVRFVVANHRPEEMVLPPIEPLPISPGVIAPDHTKRNVANANGESIKAIFDKYIMEGWTMYVYGFAEYEDIFGRFYRSRFQYHANVETILKGHQFVHSQDGNTFDFDLSKEASM